MLVLLPYASTASLTQPGIVQHTDKATKAGQGVGGGGGSHLDLLDSLRFHSDSLGLMRLTWTHLDSLELTWTHVDSLAFVWTHLDSL